MDNIDELVPAAPESDGAPRTEAIEKISRRASGRCVPTQSDHWIKGQAAESGPSQAEPTEDSDPDAEEASYNQNTFMGEGALHGAMLMSALDRLPRWQGPAYRGAVSSPMVRVELPEREGFSLHRLHKHEQEARHRQSFANGIGGVRAGYTTSAVFELTIRDGRDIAKVSVNVGENEILLPPGSSFKVTDVVKQKTGAPGVGVPATEWYIVKAEQVGSPLRGGASLFERKRRAKA